MHVQKLLTLFLLFVILDGCSSRQQEGPEEETSISNRLELRDIWVRAGSQGANSAGYLEIRNGTQSQDTLQSVQVKEVNRSEVHESYTTDDGLSGMRPAENLVIPPRNTLKLEPGSFHLMLMGLERDLQPGDSLMITLHFARAGAITQGAVVRD